MKLYVNIYLAGFLITLSPNGPFVSNSFFRPKTISKVATIKTKSATIACFSSPPFLLLALSFSPFLFRGVAKIFQRGDHSRDTFRGSSTIYDLYRCSPSCISGLSRIIAA